MKSKLAIAAMVLLCLNLSNTSAQADEADDTKEVARLTKSIAAAPSAEAYAHRGMLYSRLEKHQDAYEDYNNALKLEPNEPGLLWRRAFELTCLKQYEEALADCAKVRKLEAEKSTLDYQQALRIRIRCFEMLGRMSEMVEDLKELSGLGDKTAARALKRWEDDHK